MACSAWVVYGSTHIMAPSVWHLCTDCTHSVRSDHRHSVLDVLLIWSACHRSQASFRPGQELVIMIVSPLVRCRRGNSRVRVGRRNSEPHAPAGVKADMTRHSPSQQVSWTLGTNDPSGHQAVDQWCQSGRAASADECGGLLQCGLGTNRCQGFTLRNRFSFSLLQRPDVKGT